MWFLTLGEVQCFLSFGCVKGIHAVNGKDVFWVKIYLEKGL